MLASLLGLEVRGHEAVTQGAGDTGKRAFLGQQQTDLGQRLACQFLELDQSRWQLLCRGVVGVLLAPGFDGGLLLLQSAGAFHGQGQAGPAGQGLVAGGLLQLLCRQRGDQGPDRVIVGAGSLAAEQWAQHYALLCSGQGLAVGFKGGGVDAVGAHLLLCRQLGEVLQAGVREGAEGGFGLVAAHGQFGAKCGGEDLLGGLERIHGDLLENACGARVILLLVCQVGSAQAQQGGIFGRRAGRRFFEQLLDAGVRRAWQLSEAG
ncbi:hypothetical protein D3C78_980400 [compost metagenome]